MVSGELLSLKLDVPPLASKWLRIFWVKSSCATALGNYNIKSMRRLRLMPDITQRMLTRQLRELEKHGIIERKIYPQIPPKVEYSLSNLGLTLLPVIEALADWGLAYKAIQLSAETSPLHK